ncbi:MAG: hypothetical protein ACI4PM_07545 [Butyricicoccus sp.]
MNETNFVGYEYQSVNVKRSMVSVYADGYENFGWEYEGMEEEPGKLTMDTVTMRFKRNRKIPNKAELTRLQRNFNVCIKEILSLEASKRTKASVIAYTVGIVGTAFMAGSVFSVTAGKIIPCIILAIPAFIGWILPYFVFRNVEKKRTEQVMPLIDQKYDELYAVCERAHALLV